MQCSDRYMNIYQNVPMQCSNAMLQSLLENEQNALIIFQQVYGILGSKSPICSNITKYYIHYIMARQCSRQHIASTCKAVHGGRLPYRKIQKDTDRNRRI